MDEDEPFHYEPMGDFPQTITPSILARNAHIPDEDIRRDIAVTEEDIRVLENGLKDAREFLAFLQRLLEARGASRTND